MTDAVGATRPDDAPETLLGVARQLADLADPITMRYFGQAVDVATKADGSPVTAADRDVEAALRHALASLRPDDAVLGEEQGGDYATDAVTWVIDPIDATKNFMRGVPVFATLIGAVRDGRTLAAVVSTPAMGVGGGRATGGVGGLGARWEAHAGGGARCDGRALEVSGITELSGAQLLHGGIDHHRAVPGGWERLGALADAAWRMRGFGDFWGHLLVASGMAEACFEPELSPWDVVAPACIVTEAGGRVTTWDGGPVVQGGSVLSSNGHLHDEVAERLTADPVDPS